jgi:type I restriction-modification system DNA methylase subunit
MAQTNANLIWKIADLLRGAYQPNQYGDVMVQSLALGQACSRTLTSMWSSA